MSSSSISMTQRIGAGGNPEWYQIAVPVMISRMHLSSPYQ